MVRRQARKPVVSDAPMRVEEALSRGASRASPERDRPAPLESRASPNTPVRGRERRSGQRASSARASSRGRPSAAPPPSRHAQQAEAPAAPGGDRQLDRVRLSLQRESHPAYAALAALHAASLIRAAAKRGLPPSSATRCRLVRLDVLHASQGQPFAFPWQGASRTSGGRPSRSFSRTTRGANTLHCGQPQLSGWCDDGSRSMRTSPETRNPRRSGRGYGRDCQPSWQRRRRNGSAPSLPCPERSQRTGPGRLTP